MRKKLDENDLVLKWPPPFRDGLKFTDHDLGILDIIIYGQTEIAAKKFKEMKKFGYIFDGICVSTFIDKSLKGRVDIQNEDDVSAFLMTIISFRDYQAPPLENGGKSDKQVLKKRKRQQTEVGVAPRESACSGSTVDTDHHRGDDMSR